MEKSAKLSSIILFLFLLCACEPSSDDIELTEGKYAFHLSAKNEDAITVIRQAEKAYEEAHPGIELNITYINEEADGWRVVPDIYFGDAARASAYAKEGKLETLPAFYANAVNERVTKECLHAFRYGDVYSCFPMGIRVGPSFYYDSSVFSEDEVSNWDTIIEKTEALGGQTTNALSYFSAAEFMGAFYANGLDTLFDKEGTEDNLNTAKGLSIAKGLSKLLSSECVDSNATLPVPNSHYSSCAGIEYWPGSIADYFGENLAVAAMPSFSLNGEAFSWASYYYTYGVAVRKQANENKRSVILDFAYHLSRQEDLLLDYQSVAKEAGDEVSLTPLALQQIEGGKEYTDYPMEWYSIMGKLIKAIKDDCGAQNDALLQKALDDYHDSVMGIKI